MRFSKFIVTLVVLLNMIFTLAFLYAFIKTGSEPATLITAWFTFTTGELWMLAGIKKTKVKHKYYDTTDDNTAADTNNTTNTNNDTINEGGHDVWIQ